MKTSTITNKPAPSAAVSNLQLLAIIAVALSFLAFVSIFIAPYLYTYVTTELFN